jgi:3-dehydroquinate dehydratase
MMLMVIIIIMMTDEQDILILPAFQVLSSYLFISPIMAQDNSGMQSDDLLNAFRAQYQHFSMAIPDAIQSNADPVVLARLGDDLDEYYNLAQEVRYVPFQ